MPKVHITEELSSTLRKIRQENHVKGITVANYINKTPAYISKLEKNELKTIDEDTLIDIFLCITNNEHGKDDLDLLSEIYSLLRVFYTPKELEQQIWFQNFESVRCKLPIPEELIDAINNSIQELEISRSYLLSRINANEALSPETLRKCSSAPNQWQLISASSEGKHTAIMIQLPETILNDILDKSLDRCPYIFIFCIVFYIKKIKQFKTQINIDDSDYDKLFNSTTEYLNNYRFYTISNRSTLISSAKDQLEANQYLTSYDSENQKIVESINDLFSFIREIDIKKANVQLNSFLQNMEWDIGFMITLMSLNFASLTDASYANKKEILEHVKQMIEDYKTMPKEKKIENY